VGTVTNEAALCEPVRTEGGDATVYIARVTCTNCGYMGRVKILVNMTVAWAGTCPHCNQRDLRQARRGGRPGTVVRGLSSSATGVIGTGPRGIECLVSCTITSVMGTQRLDEPCLWRLAKLEGFWRGLGCRPSAPSLDRGGLEERSRQMWHGPSR